MNIISDAKKIDKKMTSLIKKYQEIYIATAWATLGSDSSQALLNYSKKISMMIVGVSGYNTSPEFIETFLNVNSVKYMFSTKGVIFHPKIYLFMNSKSDWECLIGSANFTRGGLANNIEMMVHLNSQDADTKTFIDNILDEINKYFSLAYRMTHEKYQIYLKDYNAQENNRNNVDKSNENAQQLMTETPINLLSWKNFFDKAKHALDDSLEERLKLLEHVQEYFKKYSSLSEMPDDIVRQIAGTINYGEHDVNWMYFGHMVSPYFKKQIIESADEFSKALDAIPLEGEVSKEMYMKFVNFVQSNVPYGFGVKSLSRLLAMKRPDIFYCVTKNNTYPVYRDFNMDELKQHDYERYWDEVIVNIHDTPWYKSLEPSSDEERKVWKVRAAMLDIITY
ncbi:phospholipase D family protein [Sulfurimonas diazotrophicus]|uniref:Phospholipase D family protein n=1 Tax=Sulfurimonas diazotrophicus TaxID=3131939 RepID=A0ABZ3HCD5_9BACT